MNDYDILPFADGNGELWLGNGRSASFAYRADLRQTQVVLYEALPDGKDHEIEGYCIQMEKAPDVCREWVEDGEVSIILNRKFYPARRPAASSEAK